MSSLIWQGHSSNSDSKISDSKIKRLVSRDDKFKASKA